MSIYYWLNQQVNKLFTNLERKSSFNEEKIKELDEINK